LQWKRNLKFFKNLKAKWQDSLDRVIEANPFRFNLTEAWAGDGNVFLDAASSPKSITTCLVFMK